MADAGAVLPWHGASLRALARAGHAAECPTAAVAASSASNTSSGKYRRLSASEDCRGTACAICLAKGVMRHRPASTCIVLRFRCIFLCVQYTCEIRPLQEGRCFFADGRAGAFLHRFRLRARLRTAARPTCAFILKKRRPPQPFFPKRGALRGRIGGETIFRPFSHKKTRAAGS